MSKYQSWGRWPRIENQDAVVIPHRFANLPDQPSMLPYGNGRSYGDVCLNDHGHLLVTRSLDHFIRFDMDTGALECESGVTLSDIIQVVLPHGWFFPVTPGTSLVTVGGAIANDVHGKNHHQTGSFGNHVIEFDLLRSNGEQLLCSRAINPQWFAATVGGLGLTGLIRRVKLQLRRVPGPWIRGDSERFGNLAEFFTLARASDASHEYTVAWLDCASRSALGRGIFLRGNHAACDRQLRLSSPHSFPLTPPFSLVNGLSLRAFNFLYFHRPSARQQDAIWDYRGFFYPLDSIHHWNRMYGPRGFFQYQCVVPNDCAEPALTSMLQRISRSGLGSFLVVLKQFGDVPSLGMLSFPRAGVTLALDFPNRGPDTLRLLDELDHITREANGAVYPAKDARMSSTSFKHYFPRWLEFSGYIDRRFSSSFWRRVSGAQA